MPPWTDAEITRFTKRVALFKRRHQSEDQAERIAERLVLRDRELDRRRLCIECANLTQGKACFVADKAPAHALSPIKLPLTTILQRCTGFAWQVP